MTLFEKCKRIRLIVMDVDGVLTDGSLLVLQDGQMLRSMNVKDGYALQLAVKKGFEVMVLSGGDAGGVVERLRRLGITNVYMQCTNKLQRLENFLQERGYKSEDVVFLGDDIPDYESMQFCGLSCCPADAVKEIKGIADYISKLGGGKGFVREVVEMVMKMNNKWQPDATTPSA